MAYEEIIFPNNIRSLRLARGIRMTKLAKDASLSLSAMSKIEKGVRRLNQTQLLLLCNLLGCKISDVFIKATDEVAGVWQQEMKKRLSANSDGGLKIFGAGIRFLRKRANITIADAANRAKMTLSVYHKIEVGQRGLFEPEVEPLAAVFGITADKMFSEIAELYKSEKLGKFMQKTEAKVKSVMTPGDSEPGSLYGANIYEAVRQKLVPVFAEMNDDELVFVKTDDKMIAAPAGLEGRESVYALRPDERLMGKLYPKNASMFADSAIVVADGDMAVYLSDDFDKLKDGVKTTAIIVKVAAYDKGKLGGITNTETVVIKNAGQRLHKIIQIVMD